MWSCGEDDVYLIVAEMCFRHVDVVYMYVVPRRLYWTAIRDTHGPYSRWGEP